MSKRTIIFVLAISVSAGYDFHRGYSHTQAVFEGVVWVVGGFIVLGFIYWLFSLRSRSD